jgi:hypothetical protein
MRNIKIEMAYRDEMDRKAAYKAAYEEGKRLASVEVAKQMAHLPDEFIQKITKLSLDEIKQVREMK